MTHASLHRADLQACLTRLAQLQHEAVDPVSVQAAVGALDSAEHDSVQRQLKSVTDQLNVPAARWMSQADPAVMPVLLIVTDGERAGHCGILRGRNGKGQWVSEWWDASRRGWTEQVESHLNASDAPGQSGHAIASLHLKRPFSANDSAVYQLIRQEILSHKAVLRDILIGGFLINLVALATSFFSMHVYDRVVPTGALQTLLVLTLGAVLAVSFELVTRRVRSSLYERLVDQVDQRLARTVYLRFLAIRMDQLPNSVGALAGQMRGYETVRSFLTSMTTSLLIDAPFAVIFLAVIAGIGGGLALIPAVFLVVSVAIGWYHRAEVEACAKEAMQAGNLKTGLLVESVEGAEIIKSGQGGWRMLSRWMNTSDLARDSELQMRAISERAQHMSATFQQLAYILIVAFGALLVSQGALTMGALIACSILSGRVLSPIAAIPSQLVQWAHTQAALKGLDQLWALQDDHHGQEQPLVLHNIQGRFRLESVNMGYGGNRALAISALAIEPGEKVGVLGPIGAGKTSLLRILSGMYKPQEGRVLLDDVDLSQVAKPALAERLGYVAQDGRLFSGTLRDNLILGMLDPGDEVIFDAARKTGLLDTVIARHPKGLEQVIHEGGTGLSGGQRQLLNLTRAFLRDPCIWLLDEPTASMDRQLEIKVMRALKATFRPADTVVIVTHKAEMLELVDRVIVIAEHKLVMDGPKQQVLQRLQGQAEPARIPADYPRVVNA